MWEKGKTLNPKRNPRSALSEVRNPEKRKEERGKREEGRGKRRTLLMHC